MKSVQVQRLVLLACVYFLAVAIRIGVCQYYVAKHHPFMPFTGESALLYKYAETIAKGEEIPERDYTTQYPEGLSVRNELSLGWEFIAGSLYKLFFSKKTPFHSFARYFTPFFFCISVVPLFLIIRHLSGNDFGAFIGTLFYAVSLPAIVRATGQEISRENYCLPLLFFHVYFLAKYMRDTKISSSILAGVFLLVALAFWEGAQVYFYGLVIFMVLQFLFSNEFSRLLKGFTVITMFACLSALLIPYLRSHFFITSYPMLASFSLVGTAFLFKKKRRTVAVLGFVLLLLALFLVIPTSQYNNTYSHMQNLLWYKLRFLNQKPYDPNLLPYDVRILWVPALTSPQGREILYHFSTLLLLGSFSIIPVVFRSLIPPAPFNKGGKRGIKLDEEFLFVNLLFFFLLYLMFKRMEVFLIFFICVFIGKWSNTMMKHSRKVAIPACFAICLCVFFEGSRIIRDIDHFGRPVDYAAIKDLLSWTVKNTGEESLILSHFNLSPVISLYTGRKIVLNPKFESPRMRQKVEQFLHALFDTNESKFYSFCQEVGADFFIYPRGTFSTTSRYSWRYMTATSGSQTDCNAYMFERKPFHLQKFQLKYDNGRYLVYKIYRPHEIRSAEKHLDNGDTFLRNNLYERAISEYTKCIQIYPKYVEGYARLGTAYYLNGKEEKAGELWRTAREMRLSQQ